MRTETNQVNKNGEIYDKITERILASLKEGTAPWTQPWTAGVNAPRSMSTGKAYRGINTLLLGVEQMFKGYEAPWWGTYKQIGELGGQVRKGEKSSMAVLWKRFTKTDKDTGEDKSFAMLRYFLVFNVHQAEWATATNGYAPGQIPAKFTPPKLIEHDVVAEAEAIIAGYPKAPAIAIGGGDVAAYAPTLDRVLMPAMGQFKTVDGYYSTMFHELTHSTGHASRLNREGITDPIRFGSHKYSKEELVAEMGSAMLSAVTGVIAPQIEEHGAYIKSWLRALENDPKMVVQAAGQAQRAADHILGVEVENYD